MAERPDPTTMEGMLWNSLKVLEKALDPDVIGIPKCLFYDCKGVVILSIVEAGFIVAGSVGTGIMMARQGEGKWSAPSAVGMAGGGFGYVFGAAYRDLIIFLMDDMTLNSYAGKVSLNIGTQVNLTVGTFGRNAELKLHASNDGVGGAVAVTFSAKGAFAAVAVEGGSLNPRDKVNRDFYGEDVKPKDILFGEMEIPKDSIIPEIHEMLEELAAGNALEMPEEMSEKVEAARVEAVKSGEKARETDKDIEYVDASKEAEEEA